MCRSFSDVTTSILNVACRGFEVSVIYNLLLHTCAYKLLCYNFSSDNIDNIHIISVISVHVIARGLIVPLRE